MQRRNQGKRTPWASTGRPRSRGFPTPIARRILLRDPICALQLPGCTGASTQADHTIPHSLATRLGWAPEDIDSEDNGQGVCRGCHTIKTLQEAQYASKSLKRRTNRLREARKHPGRLD